MNPVFVVLAAIMLLIALAFVVLPLLRRERPADANAARRRALDDALAAGVITVEEHAAKLASLPAAESASPAAKRSQSVFLTMMSLVVLLPSAAIGLYMWLGNPNALDAVKVNAATAVRDQGPEMDQAVAGLETKLKQNPDDVEGWMLLGRAYKSMTRFDQARDALKQAYDRAPDNPDVQVDYAEALALASEKRTIEGESRALLEKAVKANPQHQRGLWLLGIADYQQQRYAEAVARWEILRALMPPDSDALRSVQAQIDDARKHAGLGPDAGATPVAEAKPAPTEAPATPPPADTAGDIRLAVEVDIDPKLRTQAPADAVVFVFARAASGPPMPLAVQRLKLSDLPAKVTLTEGMGMLPNLKLSQFPQVVIGARVSKTGNAIAQPGDLQTISAAVDVKRTEPVKLTIDKVVP